MMAEWVFWACRQCISVAYGADDAPLLVNNANRLALTGDAAP